MLINYQFIFFLDTIFFNYKHTIGTDFFSNLNKRNDNPFWYADYKKIIFPKIVSDFQKDKSNPGYSQESSCEDDVDEMFDYIDKA